MDIKIKARCWRHSDTSFKEIPLENLRNKIEKTNNRSDGGLIELIKTSDMVRFFIDIDYRCATLAELEEAKNRRECQINEIIRSLESILCNLLELPIGSNLKVPVKMTGRSQYFGQEFDPKKLEKSLFFKASDHLFFNIIGSVDSCNFLTTSLINYIKDENISKIIDKGIYSKSGIRLPFAKKDNLSAEMVLKPLDCELRDCLLTYWKESTAELIHLQDQAPPDKKPRKTNQFQSNTHHIDELRDYLNLINGNTISDYKTWIAIGTAIHAEVGEDDIGLALYNEVSSKAICSCEQWRYDYYQKVLGYCMTGRANEQQCFFSMTGLGSNGKSFIFERCTDIFPQYVNKIASNTFEKDCKDYNKNISSVIGKRLVWTNELSKNKPCDADKLKDFSDGTSMNVPFLYQQKPVFIRNNAKLVVIANQNPKFASDGGIDRRLRSINFVSRFYNAGDNVAYPDNSNPFRDFMADPTLTDFMLSNDGRLALFQFIIEGAKSYYQEGLKTPDQYKELAAEVCAANNQYLEFIEENFKVIEEGQGVVHKEQVMTLWKREKGKDCNFDDIRSELIRQKFIYDCNKKKKINGKVKKGCFINMWVNEQLSTYIHSNIEEED